MTFNLFGRVVIGSLREATAHELNKEYQWEENNEWENNNYVDGVTLKGTGLVPQTESGMCTGNKGELTNFSLLTVVPLGKGFACV